MAAARDGDERAFTALVGRYRPELQVHCYRMLGSFEEAEDRGAGDEDAERDPPVDARASQQPGAGGYDGEHAVWFEGRETIIEAWVPALHAPHAVRCRILPAAANRQPVAASCIRSGDEGPYQAFALTVLRIEDGLVAETAIFGTALFPAFGLPVVR